MKYRDHILKWSNILSPALSCVLRCSRFRAVSSHPGGSSRSKHLRSSKNDARSLFLPDVSNQPQCASCCDECSSNRGFHLLLLEATYWPDPESSVRCE